MKIVTFPDPVLREQMPAFDFSNPIMPPEELEAIMLKSMFENNGIGLAANQIGIRTRVFAMGHKDTPLVAKCFFNPEIVSNTEDLEIMEEGCLSFPDIYVQVKRPKAIIARWQNKEGQWEEGKIKGYDCKVFLHEFDHLEGITFQDRVSTLKWALALKKTKKGNRSVRT